MLEMEKSKFLILPNDDEEIVLFLLFIGVER